MMPYSARFAIALAAFISSCGPRPGVQLGDGIVLTRELPDSIRRKVESDQKGRAGKDEMDQANIRSASVDTLVVRPDSLILAAGDSIPLYGGPVSWTARTTAGEVVRDYAPWFRVDNSRVLRIRGDMLMAMAPGRGALLLTAAVRSDSLPPRILTTSRLVVVVR